MSSLQQAHVWAFTLSTLRKTLGTAGFKLDQGNEEIQAIFRPGEVEEYKADPETYVKVMTYLLTNKIL